MSPTRILLVRHGETDDNRNRVFQGQRGRGLNARGREQSARLAARLAGSGIRFDALRCSDLQRARETADVLAAALALDPEEDRDLREVHLGAWEGLSTTEVAERFPEEWAAWHLGVDFKRGGGESYAELGERVARGIERAADRHPGRAVLVVSHGAAIKVFVGRVLGLGAAGLRAFQGAANTAVNLVERDDRGRWTLAIWNDAAHLFDPVVEALSAPP
jgi:broad specificity phosphatase PhoE